MALYPFNRSKEVGVLGTRWVAGLLVGVAGAGEIICHVYGMSLAPAAYLIGVKRLSIFFSVILGGLLLRERPLLPRLLAAALMVMGVALLAFRDS